MELYLDTANVQEIKEFNKILVIDGVTTNPTILTRAGRDYHDTIKEIRDLLTDDQKLFVQVVSEDLDGIVEEGRKIAALKKNAFVKIPLSDAGFMAIRQLHSEGIGVLATTVFKDTQGFLAAKNGADYLAPYVNRMKDYTDGVQETISLQKMLRAYNMNTKVVAASFHYVEEARALMQNGVDALTVPTKILRQLFQHQGSYDTIKNFSKTWKDVYGETTLNI